MPAKIALPTVGDSTCAFGSHKCNPNTGILTRNLKTNLHLIREEEKHPLTIKE